MLGILATFNNTNLVDFPNTLAVDSSGALATDGTEFIAALVNDYCFGILQAELNYTGQEPNGVVESITNSQHLESLRRGFSYPGQVFAAAWNNDPASLGIRAIKMIGQGVSRVTYAPLDAATYVGDANNAAVAAAGGKFYRADNANGTSPNIAGVYLILPDMRGCVIRGLDTAAGVDPDGATRKLGHKQLDAFQGHRHQLYAIKNGTLGAGSLHWNLEGGSAANDFAREMKTDGTNGTPRTASETRMVNIAFDIYIRY